MRKTMTLLFTLWMALSLAVAGVAASPTTDFNNPVNNIGADPWMYYHDNDGYYYFTRTTGDNLTIWRSRTMTGIDSGEQKVVWTPPSGTIDVWAPEIHFIGGKWYIYYTANTGCGDSCRGVYVVENTSADPFTGTWTGKGKVVGSGAGLDGSVFENGGTLYFLYAGYDSNWSSIYIAAMSNPWTLSTSLTKIATRDQSWESDLAEGPEVIKRNGKIFISYSTFPCWSDDYRLGMLTAADTANLLSTSSWTKSSGPVFQSSSANNVYGTGHNSFTKSKDGTQDWLVYHANTGTGQGCGPRPTRVQQFMWNTNGTPNFGVPASPTSATAVPAGEFRIEAEHAALNNASINYKSGASHGAVVGYIDYSDSYVLFKDINAPAAGHYKIHVRYTNGSGAASTHHVSVNGSTAFPISYSNIGWETYGDSVFETQLKKGYQNTIKFTKGEHYAEIDSIELEWVGTAYGDNFNDGNANGWTTYDGTWSVNSGAYGVNSGAGYKAVANGTSLSDFVYEGDVKIASGGDAGLLFRVSEPAVGGDSLKGYYAALNTNNTVVLGKFNNSWTYLTSASFTVTPGTTYHMKVVASGTSIKIYVTNMDTPVVTFTDSSYSSGGIGLRTFNSAVSFDNLVATPVFADGFGDNNPDGWATYGGGWGISGGAYSVNAGSGYKSVFSSSSFSNVLYEGDVRITSGGGDAGLLFRVTDPATGADSLKGYYAAINTGGSVILGKFNNNWTYITGTSMTITTGTTYHLKVVAEGTRIRVYVNDMATPKIDVTDTSFPSGSLGARVSGPAAAFDNFYAESRT
ncbi:family 43 glycosylhydrolase [Paenibacillus lignilyticus]|uniref:Family 43 glycosylhydrolase n=1 Tax=Paenibacillus lignilyticus TaxID=1172615 RepID=A0ABS5CFW6_9BACL|nr:family 43 glycosylhydrolase [Paenibacillus lignilyticus]MBP3964757.1 family 43 glycosylhydrolase [Paenibacillus lignilyticus]